MSDVMGRVGGGGAHDVRLTPYETRHADVGGIRLRYIDVAAASGADDAATLLVIPGHTARIEGFDEMVPRLSENFRVLVVDLPGSGFSDKPVRRYDLAFYEDVLLGLLDVLDIDRAVPVGGSLGGNLVLRLGHRCPDRFERLVLWAPGGAWTARPRTAAFIRRICGRRLFWPTVKIQSRYWYDAEFPGRQAALDETFAYYRRIIGPGFLDMYWGIAADQIAHSLFDIAPEITQPTLLMWGDHDDGAGMGRGVAELHRLIPDNELVVFPGARHSLETEIPSTLAETIVAFLEPPDTPPEIRE